MQRAAFSDSGGIVAIGGANLDWTCRLAEPVRWATSNPGSISSAYGGVARNVAVNLARLGVPAALSSVVGSDAAGAGLIADCAQAGVDCSLVLTAEGATSTYVATLDPGGELVLGFSAMDVIGRLTPERIAEQEPRLARAGLIFADANLAAVTLLAVAAAAARYGVPLALEPVSTRKAPRLAAVLAAAGVFLMTPNRDELGVLTDMDVGTDAGLAHAARQLRSRGVANVVVGLGAAGAFFASADAEGFVAARGGVVRDVTGAGDAAVAGLLWALRLGADLPGAARAAQAAAAATVACAGAVTPGLSPAMLSQALAPDPEMPRR